MKKGPERSRSKIKEHRAKLLVLLSHLIFYSDVSGEVMRPLYFLHRERYWNIVHVHTILRDYSVLNIYFDASEDT